MDEPFQGVDATTERAIIEVLRALQARGSTVVARAPRSGNRTGIF